MYIAEQGVDRMLTFCKMMGDENFNLDEYKKSESFKSMCENAHCYLNIPDESGEDALAYWKEKGLIKEVHRADEPTYKWASYLPVSAGLPENKERKYPLLFVLHGNANPIYLAEAYGYTHIAAREELITIIPDNESNEEIDKLIDYAFDNYPVDRKRVYMVGFSQGGLMTGRHIFRRPELFAAAGIGGMMAVGGAFDDYWQGDTLWPGDFIGEDKIAHTAELKMPVCCCMGENEMIHVLPISEDGVRSDPDIKYDEKGRVVTRLDLGAKAKIRSANVLRRAAGCREIPEAEVLDAVKSTDDIVTKKLGFPTEKTEAKVVEGREHYIGDCINDDGENLLRLVCAARSPHFPTTAHVETIWNFISRFARDPESGELIEL